MNIVKEALDMEFDFSNQPLDRYKVKRGVKGPMIPNPRKQKHGLNDFEEKQLEQLKIKLGILPMNLIQ